MKSIILLSSHYTPETGAAAKRSQATAQYLQANGWQVTVVTLLPHHPANEIYEGFDTSGPIVSSEEGVRVVRYRPWLAPKTSLALRLGAEIIFCWYALLYVLRHPHNIVFGSSPYMFLGPTALLAGRITRAKVVWEVRDLTWLYPRSVGKQTFGLDTVLEKLMRWSAKRSDALITVTKGFVDYFGHPPQAHVVPNGVMPELLEKLRLANTRTSPNVKPSVLYAGLLGFNQHITILLESAKLLPEVEFTIIGDGPEKKDLLAKAAALCLENVRFRDYLKTDALVQAYAEHDILVSHIRRDDLHRWTQPSKVWEYMATGKPVIHAGQGEIVKIIEQGRLGLCPPPEDPAATARAIQRFIDAPEEARAFAERGRDFVKKERNRSILLERLHSLLTALVDES